MTAEIARRAHASKQTLYRLFPTKADLFVGVMTAHTESLFAAHVDYIESNQSPRRALAEMGEMMLKMFSAPTFLSLYRISGSLEAESFPALARQLWSACMERGYGLLAEYLESRPHRRPQRSQIGPRGRGLKLILKSPLPGGKGGPQGGG